jgi:DNA-binding IclR family transcriptional regulator
MSNYLIMQTDNRDNAARDKAALSQTLARGLRLLDLIADGREGVAVRELAATIGLPRSIVQRLLTTLEAEGFLERHPSQVGFRLAMKMWSLGCVAIRRLNLREVARPVLEDLARKTSEMVKIGILDGYDVVYLDGIECPQAVRAYVPIGGRLPAHSIATGKAILAFLPPHRLAAIAAATPAQARKGAGADALARELERTRKRGYAINRGDWSDEVGGVAAPLFDAQGEAIGSVGIIMPLNRLTSAKTLQLGAWAVAAASAISGQLGHRPAADAPRLKRAG